jgi:hypothetical protein
MKNKPQNPREVRLQRLYASHAAISKAIRRALDQADQSDAFGASRTRTKNAEMPGYATIEMTIPEAHALASIAIPRSARTIPTMREHALLMIAMAQLLEELAAISTDTVPYSAITAAQHLAVQVRDWLVINNQVVMQRGDRMSEPMTGRPRFPDAQARLPRGKTMPAFGPFSSWHKHAYAGTENAVPNLFATGGKAGG